MVLELLTLQKGKILHSHNSTIVLKNEDNISLFLIQTFNKGGGGKPFMQIREVYKKALTHMYENSLAQACLHAAALGHFLMAPVKSVDVDNGSQLFMQQKKIIVYCTKFLLAKTCQRKEESSLTEKSSSIWAF